MFWGGFVFFFLKCSKSFFSEPHYQHLPIFSFPVLKSIWFSFAQNPWFRKSRFKGGKGKKLNIGGGGLGYRERPGLGSESSVSRDAEEVLYRFLELLNSGLTSLWLFFFVNYLISPWFYHLIALWFCLYCRELGNGVILLNSALLRPPAPLPFCHPQDHEPNCATA